MPLIHCQSSQRKTIDIGAGLIMRWSSKADTDNVAKLVGDAFRWFATGDPLPQDSVPPPNEYFRAAARRLLSGKNVAMSEHDYALVEDTKREKGKNPIVACVALHRCLAYYGSVDMYIGKPELIATDPDYRNKGLVRKLLMEMIHPESEARGDIMQFIGGIYHFYRQFGYEYSIYYLTALKIESANVVPNLEKGQTEPYTLRKATANDIVLLKRLSTPENRHVGAQLGVHYTTEYWQYTVVDVYQDKQSRFDGDRDTRVIVDAASGRDIGFTVVKHSSHGAYLEAMALESDIAYVDVKDSALRQLFAQAIELMEMDAKEYESYKKKANIAAGANSVNGTDETAAQGDATKESSTIPFNFSLHLHESHPLVVLLGDKAVRGSKNNPGFRMYARIPSYPAFIKAVAPELEKRLAKSSLAGVSGRLRLDFFRHVEGTSGKGLEIVLEKGKIADAVDWTALSHEKSLEERLAWKKQGKQPTIFYAAFAPLTFSPLLTGKASLEELQWSYGENSVKDDTTRLLLNTLFPKVDHHFDTYNW
ncbi:hypothetical protein EDD11_008010 [Mortierella claussenii]|nr:hypothetical protein EDD11_008010 [Mortierella claussenii]